VRLFLFPSHHTGNTKLYKQKLPAGSEVTITKSDYKNEGIFFERFKRFQKHRSPGKCLLILDGYASHSYLVCLAYYRENTLCDYEVHGMVLLGDLNGAMPLGHNKDMSTHVLTCTSHGFNALTPVMWKMWR
jgi:hypothetical protein